MWMVLFREGVVWRGILHWDRAGALAGAETLRDGGFTAYVVSLCQLGESLENGVSQ